MNYRPTAVGRIAISEWVYSCLLYTSRQKHISELYYYWYYFYQLRSLTLWDFERDTELEAEFEEVVRGYVDGLQVISYELFAGKSTVYAIL